MDDAWAAEIGQRMKAARKAAGMSRAELAEAMDRSEAAIGAYEQGKRAPFKEIRAIARLLNADVAQLLHGDEYQAPLDQIVLRLGRIEATLATVPGVSAPPELPVELGRFVAAAPPIERKAPRKSSRQAADAR